ncbi:MAG: helix-turn-helix, type 11 domain protein [Verrucomicrobiales bacterium]|nr:helix-turn-helix, type 11 domain protein [Verrucomicrobiales bacterium]
MNSEENQNLDNNEQPSSAPNDQLAMLRRDTRKQDTRVAIIHDELNTLKWVSAKKLSDLCGCHVRSIARDIAHMKDDLLLPIVEEDGKGYRYEELVNFFPFIRMTEKLFFSLMLAVKSVGAYRTNTEKRLLSRTFNQISTAFCEKRQLDPKIMDRCFSFGNMLTPRFDPSRIDFLWRCATEGIRLKMRYATPGKPVSERLFDVYELYQLRHDLIAFGYDWENKEVRRFSLTRMVELRTTGQTFERPEDFDAEDHLDGALDVFIGPPGTPKMDIKIHFTQEKAHVIRENDVRSEVGREELPNAGLILHLQLTSFVDVLSWIGEFRGEAVPLEPRDLVVQWRADMVKGLAKADAVLAGTYQPGVAV